MSDVSHDPEQTPQAPIPTPAAPSPQMFARPAPAAATNQDATNQDTPGEDLTSDDVTSSRFASTGDPRVDRAVAQLPDPEEHRHEPTAAPERADTSEGSNNDAEVDAEHEDSDAASDDGEDEAASGIDPPDPALLDAHLADVTSVHRQLQQRLSDLSG